MNYTNSNSYSSVFQPLKLEIFPTRRSAISYYFRGFPPSFQKKSLDKLRDRGSIMSKMAAIKTRKRK